MSGFISIVWHDFICDSPSLTGANITICATNSIVVWPLDVYHGWSMFSVIYRSFINDNNPPSHGNWVKAVHFLPDIKSVRCKNTLLAPPESGCDRCSIFLQTNSLCSICMVAIIEYILTPRHKKVWDVKTLYWRPQKVAVTAALYFFKTIPHVVFVWWQ